MSSSDPESYAEWIREDLAGEGPPRHLGRYDLDRRLGAGGAAVVYLATDRELGRRVAVKILRDTLAAIPTVRERFHREARAAAGISHPNVVAVHDLGEVDGRLFLVMEHVEARPLNDPSLRSDRRKWIETLELAARGVGAAHRAGIVHRDLKPSNLLVPPSGAVKVADFGLAHIVGGDESLTRTGTVLGTPLYMAPEQVQPGLGPVGPATDVHALGAMLYEGLAGRPPFAGDSLAEIYRRIVSDDPAPPPEAPHDLVTIAMKALAKDPRRRYVDAEAFADDLRRWLEGRPIQARTPGAWSRFQDRLTRHRTGAVLAGVAALAAAAGIAWAWIESGRSAEATARRRATEDAVALLERGRAALESAERALYQASSDPREFVRGVEAGQETIERGIGRAPWLPLGHHLMGRAWELRGWEDRAAGCWRRAIECDPGFGPARRRLARMLLVQAFLRGLQSLERGEDGLLAEVGRLLQEAERVLAGSPPDEDPVLAESVRILRELLTGDRARAAEMASAAIAACRGLPGEEELHWIRGSAAFGEERLRSFDEALRIRPKYPAAICCRALHRTGRVPSAQLIAEYTSALEVHPRMAIALLMRGDERQVAGDLPGAIADYDAALSIDPTLMTAYMDRGVARNTLKDFDGAIEDFTRAIGLDGRYAKAYLNRANAHRHKGDYASALRDADEALRLNPLYAKAHLLRCLVRWNQEDAEGAIEDANAALSIDPGLTDARFFRGEARRRLGRTEEALDDYRRALAAAPEGWPLRAAAESRVRELTPR